jgi:hypothetical protein
MEGFSKEEQLMLEDYKACLDMLRHEDGRKSQLFTVFFVIQGALFGLYGLVVQNRISGGIWLAVVAILLSLLWFLVMERMRAFVDLRYIQGEQLEKRLKGLNSVRYELALRKEGEVQIMDDKIRLHLYQRVFSISKHLECLLPIITGAIWLALILVLSSF